jgi:hypothetical protein
MVDLFPNSNLATASQPWGREVQKRLANLESQFSLQRTNSATIDAQLQASYRRLDQTVKDLIQADLNIQAALAQSNIAIVDAAAAADDAAAAADDAQNAIDGLIGLGSTGSDYTLNASNIVGGTITGVTVQTGSSGQRIVLSGTTLDFYSPGGTYSGKLVQEGGDSVPSVNMESSSGSNYVQVWNSGARMVGDGSSVTAFFGQVYLAAGLVSTSSSFTSGGTFTASSSVFMPSLGTDSSAANMRVGTGGAGQVFRSTASSRMFKNSITPITEEIELDPKKLLEIPVVAFKYNEDYLRKEDTRFNKMIPGFIAEDMKEIYPIAIEQDGGDATDWNPRYVVPSMLALIQELYTRIETLENGAANG